MTIVSQTGESETVLKGEGPEPVPEARSGDQNRTVRRGVRRQVFERNAIVCAAGSAVQGVDQGPRFHGGGTGTSKLREWGGPKFCWLLR